MRKATVVILATFLSVILNGFCFYLLFYYLSDSGGVGGGLPGLNRIVGPIIGVLIGLVVGVVLGLIIALGKLHKVSSILTGIIVNGLLPVLFLLEQLSERESTKVLQTALITVPVQILLGGFIGLLVSTLSNPNKIEPNRFS